MKRITWAALVLMLFAFAGGLRAEDPETTPPADAEPSVWMRMKLKWSQGILEGMAKGDFDQINTHARAMNGLGKVEFFVRGDRTPGYREQLRTFLRINEELIEHADNDNLEGVTLSFNQLTVSCVSCHQQLRRSD